MTKIPLMGQICNFRKFRGKKIKTYKWPIQSVNMASLPYRDLKWVNKMILTLKNQF